jgi:hypothetical protein
MRPEGCYDSHESSDDDDGLELISVVDHFQGKKAYFANNTRQYSNVEIIDGWSETAGDWRIRLQQLGRGA